MRMLPKSLSPRALTQSLAVKHREILRKKILFCFCYHCDKLKDSGNRCKREARHCRFSELQIYLCGFPQRPNPTNNWAHPKWSHFQTKNSAEERNRPVTSAWVWMNNSFLVSPPQRNRVSMKCPALFMLSIMWRVPYCKWKKKGTTVLYLNQYSEKLRKVPVVHETNQKRST